MNIQIFGTNKSFDTKKAQRWFKERRIKFQMVDLKEKGLSRGEFDRVCQAVGGWQALVDETAKDQDTLALLRWLDESQQADKLFENQQLFANPLYAMAAPPQWGTGRRFGRSGNKVRSSEHCMQAEPSCQLLFLVNSLILAFYLLLCLLLSALHFVLLK